MKARDWLVELRKQKGMTQEEVAKKVKINRSFYTQIENGTRNPSVDTAQKIAGLLSFDWTLFFEASSHKERQSPQTKNRRHYTKHIEGEFHVQR
ncbi:MAG: helix-turn-helix transcriptional regulator [Hydrogenibacillus schlegelii]|uniref:Helix-turn-helix transcriptional regulator n=1 Tax=Hydrogenibacillus schlegelii TaxID=1484 RepID=A0A947CX82_HYDSH|nr:helix-turn-helix transcriptional regulator [Hydrogenibacillus schlegelii]